MTELKPCPFCKSKDAPTVRVPIGYENSWYVVCRECDAEGPSDFGKSGAIEAWNTRPLEAQLLAACKALVEYRDRNTLADAIAAIAAAEGDAP